MLFGANMLNNFLICVNQRTIVLSMVPTQFNQQVTIVGFLSFPFLFALLWLLSLWLSLNGWSNVFDFFILFLLEHLYGKDWCFNNWPLLFVACTFFLINVCAINSWIIMAHRFENDCRLLSLPEIFALSLFLWVSAEYFGKRRQTLSSDQHGRLVGFHQLD